MAANNPGRAMHRDKPILLLSRPEADSQRFLTALPDALLSLCAPIIAPVFRIATFPIDPPRGEDLILSSSNAIDAVQDVGRCRAWCIGEVTTQRARQAGFDARYAGSTADDLVDHLGGFSPQSFTHLRGKHTRGDIAGRLRGRGHKVEEKIVYDQIETPWSDAVDAAVSHATAIVAPVFSPRSGRLLSGRMRGKSALHVVAMSESVALEFEIRDSKRMTIASEPDSSMMMDATTRVLKQVCRVEGNPHAL